MILATTETIAGRTIAECLGIVTAETVVTPKLKQMLTMSSEAAVTAREEMLFEAREATLDKLASHAAARGGDAVVAISLDFELVEATYGMLVATGAGTAVRLTPVQE